MNRFTVPALTISLCLALMGATSCPAKAKSESCNITARDTTTITMQCTDEDGVKTTREERHPSDLYPLCQVNTYWPGCKQK